jgi:ubiquinone/menaquinone biosynthesis C-methylase UbiE
MDTKDYFSKHSRVYAAFRPTYPKELYDFIFSHTQQREAALDCATGNGQVAGYLANHFSRVYATDISKQQIEQAAPVSNIIYSVSPAEKTPFENHTFDLITVGQAIHWFNRTEFYDEVKRVGKPGAVLAVWGYSLLTINPEIDVLISDFYFNVVGTYWDDARRLVEQRYQTIDFPFEEFSAPEFFINVRWTIEHLHGYLESWSATQRYIGENNRNPVPDVIEKLGKYWNKEDPKSVSFPVFMRIGRI